MEEFDTISVEEIINSIILEKLHKRKVEVKKINGGIKFSDIDFDSLDVMETIIEAEGLLKTKIENKRIKNIFSICDVYRLFEND